MKVVCIAGPSDAGKTTLVEELVPRLAKHGRVGTVKSIHHEIEIDTPGTDTHRHRTAGAETVVGITPTLTFDVCDRGKRNPPPDPDVRGVLEERATRPRAGDPTRDENECGGTGDARDGAESKTEREDANDGDSESGPDPDLLELRALESALVRLDRRGYEFVLVEGFAAAPLPTILVGDRPASDVGGEVVARGDDDLADLVETIRGLEALAVGRD